MESKLLIIGMIIKQRGNDNKEADRYVTAVGKKNYLYYNIRSGRESDELMSSFTMLDNYIQVRDEVKITFYQLVYHLKDSETMILSSWTTDPTGGLNDDFIILKTNTKEEIL